MPMGRKRTRDFQLPPRMSLKRGTYYHVSNGMPRKWTALGKDLPMAKLRWAQLEQVNSDTDSFDALADRYEADHLHEHSKATQAQYGIYLRLLRKVFGGMSLSEIGPQDVAEFLDSHTSPTMANNQISFLGVLYEKAMRWGWAKTNPIRTLINVLRVRI